MKESSAVGSFSFSCLCLGKLAQTCSSTHPNRWAQSIPLSSTSSEAARPFVLSIHKRPFKWRHSVISEILASGLCRTEKRRRERVSCIEKKEREQIHPWPINSNYLSGFLAADVIWERGKKCARSRCKMYKEKGRLVPPPTEKKKKTGRTLPHPSIFDMVSLLPTSSALSKYVMHCMTSWWNER